MRLTVPIRLRWSDIDAYAHVNNAAMLGLLEEVRIQAFWAVPTGAPDASPPGDAGPDGGRAAGGGDHGGPAVLDGRPGAATLSLIAHQEIEYLRPIPYGRQPLDCEVWIARLGGASLDVHYEVFSPRGEEPRVLTTRAASTLVLVDAATQRPRRISDAERAAWSPYLEDPVRFTARR
ncbi:acyl-CoA thioesterase [Amnibacterium kyonggiense]